MIEWIDIQEKQPPTDPVHFRRKILIWYIPYSTWSSPEWQPGIVYWQRSSLPDRDGEFDFCGLVPAGITHWAEINIPDDN